MVLRWDGWPAFTPTTNGGSGILQGAEEFVASSGQHSIRINDEYRLCFVWIPEGAEQVEIVDYH